MDFAFLTTHFCQIRCSSVSRNTFHAISWLQSTSNHFQSRIFAFNVCHAACWVTLTTGKTILHTYLSSFFLPKLWLLTFVVVLVLSGHAPITWGLVESGLLINAMWTKKKKQKIIHLFASRNLIYLFYTYYWPKLGLYMLHIGMNERLCKFYHV